MNIKIPKLCQAIPIIFSIILICCNSQFKAHLSLQQVGGKSHQHHDLSTSNILTRNHHNRIVHNHKFIRSHLQKQKKQHKMNLHSHRISQFEEHDQAVQTFNLQPNVYSFNLHMKVGGFDYKMQIDSGSSDIFIKGEKAKGQPAVRYQCGQTCIDNNDHYELGYLDGYVETYQTTLPIELGNLKFNQSVLVAYQVQENFEDNQGLVGLSYQALSTNPNPTFLQTLKNEHIIDAYAFGVNLNFQDKNRSFITFGSYDPNYFVNSLDFYPLTSSQFYYIDTEGVSFGTGKLLPVSRALFDTGNTCISIPNKFQKDILSQFNVKGNKCYFDVEQNADMFSLLRCRFVSLDDVPVLNIHIGGKLYEIQKEFYLQACDRRPGSKQNGDAKSGVWYCDAYIQSVKRMSEVILGDGFFSRFYTYFDLETRQLAIAQNKQIITIQRIIENDIDSSIKQWKQMIKQLGDEKDSTVNNSGLKGSNPNQKIKN